jgi:hypothetical protein
MPYVTVEVDLDDIPGVISRDELNQANERAGGFLDLLIDRGIVMPLSPSMRSELLVGTRDLRSVTL